MAFRVEGHGRDRVYPGVFLHVRVEKAVHTVLKEFPNDPHRHGEAKRHQSHKRGGEPDFEFPGAVENIHHGNADGGHQETVHGVEHGVPKGENQIVFLNLSQDLRRENKKQNDDFQGVWHVDMQAAFHKCGDHKKRQRQGAQKYVVVLAVKNFQDHHRDHQSPEHHVGGEKHRVMFDVLPHFRPVFHAALLFFHFARPLFPSF